MIDCRFADKEHRVWYWDARGQDVSPVPCSPTLDNHEDALVWVAQLGQPEWLRWVKVFRADNEAYVCYRWSPNPIVKETRP